MFDIDGISQATLMTYHGYRKARAYTIFFSCNIEEIPNFRDALHAAYAHHAKMERVPTPQNHETFVLQPDILGLPFPHGATHAPILAITFSDLKVHFGSAVIVKDW